MSPDAGYGGGGNRTRVVCQQIPLTGADLARQTAERYGEEHVVPLTGGGDDPFIYWLEPDALGHRSGLVRGSYTRDRLES